MDHRGCSKIRIGDQYKGTFILGYLQGVILVINIGYYL
jgi:hypothetical protein